METTIQTIDWDAYLSNETLPTDQEHVKILSLAKELLEKNEIEPKEVINFPQTLQIALIKKAVSKEHSALIQATLQSKDKVVAKAARRGAHHLRSKGIKIATPKRASRVSVRVAETLIPSYISYFDTDKNCLVLFLRRVPLEGYYFFYIILSRENGIVDFNPMGCVSKSAARRSLKSIFDDVPRELVEVPNPYVRALIQEGIQKATKLSRLPKTASDSISQLGPNRETLSPHPVHQIVSLPTQSTSSIEKMFAHPSLEYCLLPEKELLKAEHALNEVQTSQLYVDDEQRKRGGDDALERVVLQYFSSSSAQENMKRLLEDMALLTFYDHNKIMASDLLFYAKMFASGEESKYRAFAVHLIQRLFTRSSEASEKEEEPEKSSSGLILP